MQIACVVWPASEATERQWRAWEACLDALEGFSSVVEAEGVGVAYVDITALAPHYDAVEDLGRMLTRAVHTAVSLEPAVGIAASPFAARMAATAVRPGQINVWPAGTEQGQLAPLSIRHLPLDPAALDMLWQAGLRRLDDLVRLPATVIANTLGPTLRRAQRLARGEMLRPLRPRHVVQRESSRQTFETPVYDTLRLRALGAIQVRDLAERLRLRGLRCARLRLTGELVIDEVWQSTCDLPEPTSASAILTQEADDALFEWPVTLGVLALTIALDTAPQTQSRDTVIQFRAAGGRGE